MKVEARSSQKAIRAALETDFEPQDGDLGIQEGDFGGKNRWGLFTMRILEIAQRNAQGLWSTEKYRKISYAGHP